MTQSPQPGENLSGESELLGSSLRDTHRATEDQWAVLEGLEHVASQIKHEYPVSYKLVMDAIYALRANGGEKAR